MTEEELRYLTNDERTVWARCRPEFRVNGPYTPQGGANDGVVRDYRGIAVADTLGHEAHAEFIAHAFLDLPVALWTIARLRHVCYDVGQYLVDEGGHLYNCGYRVDGTGDCDCPLGEVTRKIEEVLTPPPAAAPP